MPDLGAIKSHVQMAFPNHKVTVSAGESQFPHKMLIQANVDNCVTSIAHVDVEHPPCEEFIEDILIEGIKEVIGNG